MACLPQRLTDRWLLSGSRFTQPECVFFNAALLRFPGHKARSVGCVRASSSVTWLASGRHTGYFSRRHKAVQCHCLGSGYAGALSQKVTLLLHRCVCRDEGFYAAVQLLVWFVEARDSALLVAAGLDRRQWRTGRVTGVAVGQGIDRAYQIICVHADGLTGLLLYP